MNKYSFKPQYHLLPILITLLSKLMIKTNNNLLHIRTLSKILKYNIKWNSQIKTLLLINKYYNYKNSSKLLKLKLNKKNLLWQMISSSHNLLKKNNHQETKSKLLHHVQIYVWQKISILKFHIFLVQLSYPAKV